MAATPAGEDKLLHDARAVHDLASFPGSPRAGETWAVLRIIPAADSGSGTGSGEIHFRGKWERISGSPDAVPESGDYEWREHPKTHERLPLPSGYYNPFARGGLVICGYNAQAETGSRFDPVFLIPDAWSDAAADIIRPGALPGSNPIARLLRMRGDLEHGRLTRSRVKAALREGDEDRRAVVVYMIVSSTSPASASAREVLSGVINAPGDGAKWHAIGLAAFAAKLFEPGRNLPVAEEIVRMLRRRKKSGTLRDPMLAQVVEILGGSK